jgi:hypothetical protein
MSKEEEEARQRQIEVEKITRIPWICRCPGPCSDARSLVCRIRCASQVRLLVWKRNGSVRISLHVSIRVRLTKGSKINPTHQISEEYQDRNKAPHVVDTEGQVPYEQGGALRGPPSLGGLPAVGEGLHRGPLGWGDEGQSVSTGGNSTLPAGAR